MTDEELIARLRHGGRVIQGNYAAFAADRIEALVKERDDYASILKNSGVVEIASHNNRVTEYMFHWEGRALEAEAKLETAVEALEHAKLNMPHPDQMIDATLAELTGENP